MGKYNRMDGSRVTNDSSDKPFKGGSRYSEDTPSFESTAGGNAGQGIRGQKVFSRTEPEPGPSVGHNEGPSMTDAKRKQLSNK